jgi:hypothetical protein
MTQDQKPPVEQGDIVLLDIRERGAWVPAETVAELQADLDKCRAENKGWRGLFRRVQEALFGGKARKSDDFDSEFPG